MDNNNIAIYTCITGGYDTPTDGFEHKSGYDYFLFSDVPTETKSWKNMILLSDNVDNLSNAKKQRFIKTHPFDVLKEYDVVVWVDANTDINEKIYKYIDENKGNVITFKKHPNRDCIYDEIKKCVSCGKETSENGELVYNHLTKEGYPAHNGLFETNIIISRPNDENIKKLFNAWWLEIQNFSKRDQFSLNYVIWKLHYENLITVRETSDFKPKPHKKSLKKSSMKNNIDIFIGTYKPFKLSVKDNIYKIIVGNHKIQNNSNLELIKCENDSKLDDTFYSELYMLKWIGENYQLKDYVGYCHYRKYFNFLDNIPDMDEIFKEYDAIVGKPLQYKTTVREQYARFHNAEDLYIIGGILADKYPSYCNAWHSFLNGNIFIPYNMFIMKSEDFKEYIKFIFDVLDEYVKIVGTDIKKRIEDNKEKYLKTFYPNSTVDYQYRIGGYLGERLTNLFMMTHFRRIKTYPIKITEEKYKKNNGEKVS